MLQTVQEMIQQLQHELLAAFGSRFECLVLTGSHARGDAHAGSDIDLWLFLDHVSWADLSTVGGVVGRVNSATSAGACHRPEVNVQCTSFAEVATNAFTQGFSPLQLHFEGQVLHGSLRLERPSPARIRQEAAAIACFVTMSCRHYVTSQEPEQSLRQGKLRTWVLKPLMWALRYDVLARSGNYPRTLDELAQAPISPPARELVEAFSQLLKPEFHADCRSVLKKADEVARELMQTAQA